MAEKMAKRGDKGGHIATLNAVLFKKGYKKVPNPGDPKAAQEFTVETEKAVKDVQKKYGLKPTGMCDPAGVIYALGKKPADFKVNPTDYTKEAKKYAKAQEDHHKRASRLGKDISTEINAMQKRLDDFDKRYGKAITNDFIMQVDLVELEFDMFNESNDPIDRYERVQSIKKQEKKAEAARSSAQNEVAIAERYIKEMEAVLKQLKRVCT